MIGILDSLMISSIEANAHSLLGQLNDYSFLTITPEQSAKLITFEREFHKLVKEITEPDSLTK